jgi:hypothetical protein
LPYDAGATVCRGHRHEQLEGLLDPARPCLLEHGASIGEAVGGTPDDGGGFGRGRDHAVVGVKRHPESLQVDGRRVAERDRGRARAASARSWTTALSNRVDRLDAPQAGLDHFGRGDLSRANGRGQRRRGRLACIEARKPKLAVGVRPGRNGCRRPAGPKRVIRRRQA